MIRLQVEHLPSGATPKHVWLWWSGTGAVQATVDLLWRAFLRRFDIEHTFRLFKTDLGPDLLEDPQPGSRHRWTWLILAAFTQLRLACPPGANLRRPWEKSAMPNKLTPARVLRAFRHLRTRPPVQPEHRKPSGPARDALSAAETTSPRQTRLHETMHKEVNDPASTPHRLKIKLVAGKLSVLDLGGAGGDGDHAADDARPVGHQAIWRAEPVVARAWPAWANTRVR